MSVIDYADINAPEAQKSNMGGFTQRCFYASLDTFDTIQVPAASPATFALKVSIAIAHSFLTGFCFLKGYCTMDRGKGENKSQGETDGKSFRQEYEFFLPGSEPEAHGFAASVMNDRMIFLFEQIDSEVNGYIQVGTEKLPAKVDPEFTAATNAAGVRGHVFKVYANTPMQYIYKAAVSLTPAP